MVIVHFQVFIYLFSLLGEKLIWKGFMPMVFCQFCDLAKNCNLPPPQKSQMWLYSKFFLKWKKLRIYLYSWLSILKCIIKTWGFEGKKDFKTWQMWAFFHEFNLMYRLKTYFPRWKFAKICNKSIHPSDVLIQVVLWHSQSNHHP
jgi:hypothetical protein